MKLHGKSPKFGWDEGFEPHSLFDGQESEQAGKLLTEKRKIDAAIDEVETRRSKLMLQIEEKNGLWGRNFRFSTKNFVIMVPEAPNRPDMEDETERPKFTIPHSHVSDEHKKEVIAIDKRQAEVKEMMDKFVNRHRRFSLWLKQRRNLFGYDVFTVLEDSLVWIKPKENDNEEE